MRRLNFEKVVTRLVEFIKENAKQGVVIGISGGVDSATVAYLATKALGKDKILGLIMPYYENKDVEDAKLVAENLGIRYKIINIKPIVDTIQSSLDVALDRKSLGNIMARVRMVLLYSYANSLGRLVLGTSNRSEFLTGYFTKWGDGASDYAPLINIYKTEVWEVARIIGVPQSIVEKKPSAGLWEGQTDEDELGISYKLLDELLWRLVDLKMSKEEIANELNVSEEIVEHVEKLVKNSEHKRRLPIGPKVDDLIIEP
ncbi:NAD(+) synthetase [Pyrococcus furiosus DSM 3638]|uniref:NH(3)-dependent NAD(+) synthetase n=3 Tax=Pyrococcus furiosus TaxID=2261 RepID=NADE_PYRFU|nr:MULTISPECIES: NAD+ synthase [Pyrococcus]Q8U4I9.1 RecName: Full=NH(3)-dependent NAD(+) synthetase [Pyrococcus furiosus DSM 3638]AAL80222.1 NH(3)-dependent NAD+ synthetase [Pyrococcus furiosus DSM 3638]AFN04477.1 NAD synthetase [Pyrococcus furiosus COM1]MDK2869761.1 synthase [Pyrococcus sp.]QEK77830.1 NAD(+) synthetase [Pyrococcus furiosus DSM 3638]